MIIRSSELHIQSSGLLFGAVKEEMAESPASSHDLLFLESAV